MKGIIKELETRLGMEVKEVHPVKNGEVMDGIMVDDGNLIRPCVYLPNGWKDAPVSEVADSLLEAWKAATKAVEYVDIEECKPSLNSLFVTVRNRKRVEEGCITKDIPNTDLCTVLRCRFPIGSETGVSSTAIKKEYLPIDGVSDIDELFKIAENNMHNMHDIGDLAVGSLEEMIEKYRSPASAPKLSTDLSVLNGSSQMPFVVTNPLNVNGTWWLSNNEALNMIRKNIERGFYILPASIHECIVVAEHPEVDVLALKEMVEEVNKYVVSEQDILSDNVYYYDDELRVA